MSLPVVEILLTLEGAGISLQEFPAEQVANALRVAAEAVRSRAPVPMRLVCPRCGELHVDEAEFATKPHHTHACQFCGEVWRPAVVHTVGVRFRPGFKNAPAAGGGA